MHIKKTYVLYGVLSYEMCTLYSTVLYLELRKGPWDSYKFWNPLHTVIPNPGATAVRALKLGSAIRCDKKVVSVKRRVELFWRQ